MHQSSQSPPPQRSSRRQQGLSPLPHLIPHQPTFNTSTPTTVPNIPSTPTNQRYAYLSSNISNPSIVNTISSSHHQNPPIHPHITHQILEHEPTFHSSPSIANSSISSHRPYTAPIYLSHQTYHNIPSSYSLPPPGQSPYTSNLNPTPFQPPPNISLHDPASTNSSELRSIIRQLQQTISQLTQSLNDIRADLSSTQKDNQFLRSELLRSQQHHLSSSQSDTSSLAQPSHPLPPIPDLLTFDNTTTPTTDPPPKPPSIHTVHSNPTTTPIPPPSTSSSNTNTTLSHPPPPPPSNNTTSTCVPVSISFDPTITSHSTSHPNDHDLLLREFLRVQQRQNELHELQLMELQSSRLKKQPTNSKFPTLNDKNCNPKNFREWYQKVVSILATDEWSALYNTQTQDIIPDGRIHPALNNHLYSAILLILKDSVETLIQGMGHLFGDGIAVLHELRTTYKGSLTNIELMKLQGTLLGGTHFRSKTESVEQFASRTTQIYKDLTEHGIHIPPHTLKSCFISGLGPDFHDIIKDLNKNKLDPEWLPLDIKDLIQPARDYLRLQTQLRAHHASYKTLTAADSNNSKPTSKSNPKEDNNTLSEKDRDRRRRIYNAIRDGSFKISNFENEVGANKCIFHGTTHPNTKNSSRECTKLLDLLKQHPQPPQNPHTKTQPVNTTPNPLPSHNPVAKQTTLSPPNLNPSTTPSEPTNEELDYAISNLTEFGNTLNDTKSDSNSYLNIVSKHITLQSTSTCTHLTIIDSGAFPMMFNHKSYFTEIFPWSHPKYSHVTLADGSSKAQIQGIGTTKFLINNKFSVEFHNVLYVPSLSSNLFSVKEFLRYKGTLLLAENSTMIIAFPSFITEAHIDDEITFHTQPTTKPPIFSTFQAPLHPTDSKHYISPETLHKFLPNVYHMPTKKILQPISKPPISSQPHTKQNNKTPSTDPKTPPPSHSITPASHYETPSPSSTPNDTIPNPQDPNPEPSTSTLSQSTKTQEPIQSLPKWLHHDSKITIKLDDTTSFIKGILLQNSDHTFLIHAGKSRKTGKTYPITYNKLLSLFNKGQILRGHTHLIRTLEKLPFLTQTSQSDPHSPSPTLPTEHKPISSWPSTTSFTCDQLRKAFGFRNIDPLLPQIQATSQHNFSISTKDREKIIDLGDVATIHRSKRNTTPLPLPHAFGDIMHMDIIFGSVTAIEGFRYGLFIVDRATRCRFILPMKILKNDLLPTLQKFCNDIGFIPKRIITDFDHKLMGQKVISHFSQPDGTTIFESTPPPPIIEATPPNKQNQNGLAESNWKSILQMARAWLSSHLLPSKFWWYALKRATEISNYIPIKINNKITTPFELTYGIKPDLRFLLPMFSVAYLSRHRDGNITRKNTHSHSIRAILVGRDPSSTSFLFYHPGTQKTLTSDTFTIDETLPSGPAFRLEYDGGLYFNRYTDFNDKIRPPLFIPEQTVFITSHNPPLKATILTVPTSPIDRVYTVTLDDGSIQQLFENELSHTDPNIDISTNNPPTTFFPTWINSNITKATLYLPNMSKPTRGYLILRDNEWHFRHGNKTTNASIPLPDFYSTAHTLCKNLQLFEGHPRHKTIASVIKSRELSHIIAKHVSARNLTTEDIPTLLQHHLLNDNDKVIWNQAYAEEYFGLVDLPCWGTITEKEFQANKHLYKSILPSMAVATIKYDEFGKPKRAKYRIVALGNLESHKWTKNECYAPVMSLMELRLMVAMAIKHRRYLKCGDVKQAFVQAVLPPEEQYIVKPPVGCPYSPPGTYWKLKRTLYGLRRSPRHWFDRATKILQQIGLNPCPHAPCLFHGEIIPGRPKLYLGIYVDDFVYFSTDPEVESIFEQKLNALHTTDFMGKVTHFLGIKFQWKETQERLSVHLSQEAFSDNLIAEAGLSNDSATIKPTPFRSGLPIDSIKHTPLPPDQSSQLKQQLQSYVGSLLWLSQATRPDLAVVTNLLAQQQNKPTHSHIAAAKHIIKYIKGTKSLGIAFHSDSNLSLQSFIHFPIHSKIYALTDANWGPQDQSIPNPQEPPPPVDLHVTRSISGHLILLNGPLDWSAKRQSITARSTAESEIYATDTCVKAIIHLSHIIQDLDLKNLLMSKTTKIYNDNMACVQWSKNQTNRNIRHIQIRENATRESVQNKIVEIKHVAGKTNPADIFTKEQKDVSHFLKLRNIILSPPFETAPLNNNQAQPLSP